MKIHVNDLMQKNYSYELSAAEGIFSDPEFRPGLTPSQMLKMGVFGGKYMTDCAREFPAEWFRDAKLCHEKHRSELNYFGVSASQGLSVWRAKGWIRDQDPRGWFQWYCRYYLGRRSPDDERQIRRWLAMRRHSEQVRHFCAPGDLNCRVRQRQALLHWAYDSRKI